MIKNGDESMKIMDYALSVMVSEKEIKKKIIEKLETELKLLPEGGLCRKVINGKPYLYHFTKTKNKSASTSQKCLSNSDSELASSLKRRRFIEKSLPYLYSNVKNIDAFIKKYIPYDASFISDKMAKAYEGLSQKHFINTIGKDYATYWMEEPHESYSLYPEGLIHVTSSGMRVRSKSEAIIAGLLYVYNIPFRYEAALKVGKQTYYPDFTILKPRDGEIVYWEHFGMTNNDDYNFSMEQKLTTFIRHGITPWNNLISSYDSNNGSINAQNKENIIKAFII